MKFIIMLNSTLAAHVLQPDHSILANFDFIIVKEWQSNKPK